MTTQVSLAWAAATLERSGPHLVRSFTRHFKRHTATTPASFARSHGRRAR